MSKNRKPKHKQRKKNKIQSVQEGITDKIDEVNKSLRKAQDDAGVNIGWD